MSPSRHKSERAFDIAQQVDRESPAMHALLLARGLNMREPGNATDEDICNLADFFLTLAMDLRSPAFSGEPA